MQYIMPANTVQGVAQIALRVPAELREHFKSEARSQGRSLNTHLVMVLRAAAGGKLAGEAPAAGTENAALPGGASINHG